MRLSYLLLFLFLLLTQCLGAQQILQIEKRGSLKNRRLYPGEIVSYKLKSDPKSWYREELVLLYPDEGKIRFENRLVDIQDIKAIRLGSSKRFWNGVAQGLKVFAYQWAGVSLIATGLGTPLTWSSLFVPLTAFSTGMIVQWLNNGKTYYFENKYRLRLLDLDFAKPLDRP